MTAQTLLNSLFRYKASADEELLDALRRVSGKVSAQNLHAALRVLNHAHIVDRIFASNLERKPHGYEASWSRSPPLLNDLTSAIRETDRWYLDYASRITPEELEQVVGFTFTDGGTGQMSREEMLAHVITHSGYHRGEAGRLLPEIDDTAMRDVFAGFLHRTEPQRRL